jgi:hypothetical protein
MYIGQQVDAITHEHRNIIILCHGKWVATSCDIRDRWFVDRSNDVVRVQFLKL